MNLSKNKYNQPLTHSQIDKIGNAIIFLSEKIQPLYKTSALKLLYLIEEISIRKNGIPFFGVDFQLWRLGPVVKDIYIDLTSPTALLDSYIETKSENGTVISPKNAFNDDEFADCDIDVLETVVEKFRYHSPQDLVRITHREHFPWHKTAKEHGYLDIFQNNAQNSTDIVLDLSTLLDDSPSRKEFYLNTLDFQRQSNNLKGRD